MFDDKDRRQIENHGTTVEEVANQLARFEKGAPFLRLMGPCTKSDGIVVINKKEAGRYLEMFGPAREQGRAMKFVPASGAASRMFKFLHEAYATLGENKNPEDPAFDKFIENLNKFAFYGDLEKILAKNDFELGDLLQKKDYRTILDYLLYDKGLNLSARPKGLIPFHMEYEEKGSLEPSPQLPVRDHFLEARAYTRDTESRVRVHFTISPEHEEGFKSAQESILQSFPHLEPLIAFSFQDPATDTIAADANNQPFRNEDGSLVFRPGGHGALIKNLEKLEGDIVFIKNVDNVLPDWLKKYRIPYKGVIGGLLVDTQRQIFEYLQLLENGNISHFQCEVILNFIENRLGLKPMGLEEMEPEKAARKLFDLLNRPLRVCCMVRNEGQPGGGPFWVEEADGTLRVQIVEAAQIDKNDPEQAEILANATHFNPVDIVCGLRDYKGQPFDLDRFVDPDTYFISSKSKDGKELKALELPGLWNGAMARWNTVFVDMPLILFNPVKTVNDLLKPEHQPEPGFELNQRNYGWALDVLFWP